MTDEVNDQVVDDPDEDHSPPYLAAREMVDLLWDVHEQYTRPIVGKDADIPPLGITTTVVNHDPSGRKFWVTVVETDEDEQAEFGLDVEDMMKIVLMRVTRLMRGVDNLGDWVVKQASSPLNGLDLSGIRAVKADPESLAEMLEGLIDMAKPPVPDMDEIVVGPSIDTDGLEINPDGVTSATLDDFQPVGNIRKFYGHMLESLGYPLAMPTEPTRIDAQWIIRWDDGVVASINNVDDGPVTHGGDGPDLEEIDSWMVFAQDASVMERIATLLDLRKGI